MIPDTYDRSIILHVQTRTKIEWSYVYVRMYVRTYAQGLRYVTLRYGTIRYVTLRYVTLRYVTLHYVALRYVRTYLDTYVRMYVRTNHLLCTAYFELINFEHPFTP